MTYEQALDNAATALKRLTEGKGSMSSYELYLETSALEMAVNVIAKRNGTTIPE